MVNDTVIGPTKSLCQTGKPVAITPAARQYGEDTGCGDRKPFEERRMLQEASEVLGCLSYKEES